MPTAFKDQFFTVDPGAPPAAGTPLTFQRVEFIDEDDDGNIETNTGDTWNGNAIAQVWPGDTLTINVPGLGNITYTGVTFYFVNGDPAVFTPTDGQVLQNGTFVSSTFVTTATQTPVGSFGPTCFTPGTLIDTVDGPRLIETLGVGDAVLTMDDGPQPIRAVADDTFRATEDVAPVVFAPGAIGNDLPLAVSPQHRMLIEGWQAELFYGQQSVLVAAKHLVNGTTITQQAGGTVRYIHLLFDTHQIIWGQGIASESYYPGNAADRADAETRDELIDIFPHLRSGDVVHQTVRPVLKSHEAVLLGA